jgi:hypothetical protein
MNNSYRRYEVLLPLRFNDGTSVPEKLIADTLLELEQQFGEMSCETQQIRGQWTHEGRSYRDDLVRIFVDVPDLPQHRQFFAGFKEQLKARFQQLDIWVTTHPLEIL